jgi:dihydropyrimidinase
MCICSPPPRDKDSQQAIWNGLANSTFAIVSSDHAPFSMSSPAGKFVHGASAPFWKIPNGLPGIETRLPLLMSEGVLKGRITLQQFVALTASNAARIYGLSPHKGTVAIGADADLVIWNTDQPTRIANAMLHHAADYTPYEGMTVSTWPRHRFVPRRGRDEERGARRGSWTRPISQITRPDYARATVLTDEVPPSARSEH